MSPSDFTNRPLAGQAKNLLDDLAELDRKIPAELERGVREGYLETAKLKGLAEKLGVEAPRVRTLRWVYVEVRNLHSVQVNAYDDADAVQQVKEAHEGRLARGEVPYGFRQSYWAGSNRRGGIMSEPTTTRPSMDHELRFYTDRNSQVPTPLRSQSQPQENDAALTQPEGMPPGAARLVMDLTEPPMRIAPWPRPQIHIPADGLEF